MKKVVLLVFALVMMGAMVVANTGGFGSEKKIAEFDGEIVTKSMLEEYVNTFLGSEYSELLSTESGLKELADYYINRQILLDKAKDEIDEENKLVKGHMHGSEEDEVTENTMYISAYLKKEINDKLDITKDEMEQYKERHNIETNREAEIRLSNEKRKEMFTNLISDLRANHDIRYF